MYSIHLAKLQETTDYYYSNAKMKGLYYKLIKADQEGFTHTLFLLEQEFKKAICDRDCDNCPFSKPYGRYKNLCKAIKRMKSTPFCKSDLPSHLSIASISKRKEGIGFYNDLANRWWARLPGSYGCRQ